MPTDSPALSAAPANALLIWHDSRNIFIELTGPDKRPVIVRYPMSTTGLQSALGLLKSQVFDSLDRSSPPPTTRGNLASKHSPERMHNAHAVLRRMRMIG